MEHIPNIYSTYIQHIASIYSIYSFHIPCIYLGTILYIPKDKILHFFYHYKSSPSELAGQCGFPSNLPPCYPLTIPLLSPCYPLAILLLSPYYRLTSFHLIQLFGGLPVIYFFIRHHKTMLLLFIPTVYFTSSFYILESNPVMQKTCFLHNVPWTYLGRTLDVPWTYLGRTLTLFCIYQKAKKSTFSVILNSQLLIVRCQF